MSALSDFINSASANALSWYSIVKSPSVPLVLPPAISPQQAQTTAIAQNAGTTTGAVLASPTTTLLILVGGAVLLVWAFRRK